MKIRYLLAWMVLGVAFVLSRLAAQDVTVTDPAWLDPENPPADTLPRFEKKPETKCPAELAKMEQISYALYLINVDEAGNYLHSGERISSSRLGRFSKGGAKLVPAMRGGKAIKSVCWYAVILNPPSAGPKRKDASPRLLAVSPIVVENTDLPPGVKPPFVAWATLKVDGQGGVASLAFEDAAHESLREPVSGALHAWKFAPARKDGAAVPGEVRVPMIIDAKFKPALPGRVQSPVVVRRVPPRYPRSMIRSGINAKVEVEFVVDEKGDAVAPVIKQSNNPAFNEPVLEALKGWKFKPAMADGKPVKTRMVQPLEFSVNGMGPSRELVTVERTSKKNMENLPAEFRYDIPPKPKAVIVPVYPYALMEKGERGEVEIAMMIGDDGKVKGTKIIKADNPEFGLAMAAAMDAFEFGPAMREGRPTATLLKMEQAFAVSGRNGMVSSEDRDLYSKERKHPESVIAESALDAPPKALARRAAIFPSQSENWKEGGVAVVEALLDEEGRVRLPRVVEASAPAFGYAAVQAAIAWRYEPPKAGGKPVVARIRIPFSFKPRVQAGAGSGQ